MDKDYPIPGYSGYHLEPNGSSEMVVYDYTCIRCKELTSEQNYHGFALEDSYLCVQCIRHMFFRLFDVQSIPFLEEVEGKLTYTSKALGKRLPIPQKMRDKVFKRDKYQCVFCGCNEVSKLCVDHIHPYALGGKDTFSNFQTLCKSCNSKKGARVDYVPS